MTSTIYIMYIEEMFSHNSIVRNVQVCDRIIYGSSQNLVHARGMVSIFGLMQMAAVVVGSGGMESLRSGTPFSIEILLDVPYLLWRKGYAQHLLVVGDGKANNYSVLEDSPHLVPNM